MLKKEAKEFLSYWPLKDSKDPNIQKLRKKYEKSNPPQRYNRIIKYANDEIDELTFILDKLPANYRKKVNFDKMSYVDTLKRIRDKDPDLKLKTSLEQVHVGLDFISSKLFDAKALWTLAKPRLEEINAILEIVNQISSEETKTVKNQLDEKFPGRSTDLMRRKVLR